MEINIYSSYAVVIKGEYAYQDPETSTPDDIDFTEDTGESISVIEGGQLLDMLANEMSSALISSVEFTPGVIHISEFNPTTGESSEIDYYIRKVEPNEANKAS